MNQDLMNQLAELDKQFERLDVIRPQAVSEVAALQSDLQKLGVRAS
ncbi:hypothetical protein M3689_00935 [Alkalihalophilus marmarensis]|jgi:hypothetical protein|nr:hypothetical protein [Alkalihalophilus marmarensis]MCM3487864.1 hypothetical protein [Alkalihalophilus marmarensis]